MIHHFAISNLSILLNGWNAIQIEGFSWWVSFLMDYYSIERTILLGGQMAKGAQHEQTALTMPGGASSRVNNGRIWKAACNGSCESWVLGLAWMWGLDNGLPKLTENKAEQAVRAGS
jgi:hypothetical protein